MIGGKRSEWTFVTPSLAEQLSMSLKRLTEFTKKLRIRFLSNCLKITWITCKLVIHSQSRFLAENATAGVLLVRGILGHHLKLFTRFCTGLDTISTVRRKSRNFPTLIIPILTMKKCITTINTTVNSTYIGRLIRLSSLQLLYFGHKELFWATMFWFFSNSYCFQYKSRRLKKQGSLFCAWR